MLPSQIRNLTPARVNLLLGLGLFVLALALRLVGIGWGLPNDLHNHSYHPDEPVILSYSQQVNPIRGDFDPGFYNYGTLYLTVLRVASDMAATYGTAIDENDPSTLYKFMHDAHLAGRIISALAGAGTVVLLFFMLRRFTNPLGAFMGALLVLVAPAHTVHSRFQTPDVLATFLLAASIFYALRMLPSPVREDGEGSEGGEEAETRGDGETEKRGDGEPERRGNGETGNRRNGETEIRGGFASASSMRLAIWSGAFAGLSAGTKYTGILALLCLYIALLLTKKPGWWKAALAGTGAALVAFIVATPGVLLNTSKFLEDFKYEMVHTSTGHGTIFEGMGSGFSVHLANLVVGVGLFLTILGIGGLVIGGVKRVHWVWVVLAFFIPYFILIGRAEVLFVRYTFPLYIGLAMGFGWLMGYAHERKGPFVAVIVLGIASVVGFDLRRTLEWTAWMAGTDSRDETARYLFDEAKKEPGTTVGLVRDPWFWSPPLFKNSAAPRWETEKVLAEMQQTSDPQVIRYVPADGSPRGDWDMRLLTETKPDFVVVSSFDVEEGPRLIGKKGLSPVGQALADLSKAFRDRLVKDYSAVKIFGKPGDLPHDLDYIRPNISVWKRKGPSVER